MRAAIDICEAPEWWRSFNLDGNGRDEKRLHGNGTFFHEAHSRQDHIKMSDKKMPHQNTGIDPDRALGRTDPNRIISQKLKALYSAVEQEGIPDRFMELLEQLDEAERRQSGTDSADE